MVEIVNLKSFLGTDPAPLLREIADWLEAEPKRVLIGLWSTGFGEAWEVDLQVVTTVEDDDDPDEERTDG